jgi:hypothetical protein
MAIAGAYRNQSDLITEVLAKLGVAAPGQAPDPEDVNYETAMLDGLYRQLQALEIVNIADGNNINGVWFLPLADIVAGECATKFGSDLDTYRRLKGAGIGLPPPEGQGIGTGAAAMALKAMTRGRPTYEPLRAVYF